MPFQLLPTTFATFQFQCGAIEGPVTSGNEITLLVFQFQCGAIEGIRKANKGDI